VTLFVTMDAVPLLMAGEGWRALSGAARDDELKRRNVADMETLLEACAALGVAVMVCEAGLKAADIDPSALRDDLAFEVTGLVTFYGTIATGQIVVL
jgi:peroxiredoxin family protein